MTGSPEALAGAAARADGRLPGVAGRRVLLLGIVLPLALALLATVWRVGAAHHAVEARAAMAEADTAMAVYRAERRAVKQRTGLAPGPALYGAPVAFLDDVARAGYDAALYVAGRKVRATPASFGRDSLPGALRRRLNAEDRTTAATLPDGETGAVAPVKDMDEWNVVGALVVQPRTPETAALPAAWLAAALAAWLAVIGALAWHGREHGTTRRTAEAAIFLPPVAFAAAVMTAAAATLPATQGAALRLWAASIVGAWMVVAVVALSLFRISGQALRLREAATAWGYLAPSLAHLLVFSIGPILFALYLSFHRWNLVEAARPFVGLANYRALAGDGAFWRAVLNTAVYVLFVPVGMTLALALALLVNRPFRGVRLLRAIFFLPYITSFVAISLVWKWMFDPDYGLLNAGLRLVHLPALPWLSSPATALPSLMLMSVWMYAGYMMIIFLAGLQSIPESFYESARIDGAGAWQRFRHVTLPMLRPTTFFVLATMVIFMFQVFTAVYVMTEGGPLHATDVIVYHIYRSAWEYLRMGYASAMAWVLFAIVFLATLLQWRFLGREAP